jgi:ABC-type multidrug transport system ATPase subunit
MKGIISIRNVWHHYGIRPILKNVSLEIEQGKLVVIMGPNGMGKSTLLGLIGGAMYPIRGEIEVNGKIRRSSVEAEKAIRKQMVYLPDTPFLPPLITGQEFILSVARLYGVDSLDAMKHAETLLEVFDLKEKADSPIISYSTGQQKKLGLCSALLTEASILVLDEPFSGGLDSAALLAMSKILKMLAKREDVTIVMAVPVPELVEPLADKVVILANGEVIAYDTPANIKQQAGGNISLAEALEKLAHPDRVSNIDKYLEERSL